MHRSKVSSAALLLIAGSFSNFLSTTAQSAEAVNFSSQIQPILARNCTACHNAKTAEGGLSLESMTAISKGGDSGPTLVAGKSAESSLIERVIADDDSIMPPADNSVGAKRLTPDEVDIIRKWIDAGALDSQSTGRTAEWNRRPLEIAPVFASAVSADGQVAVIGRGELALVASTDFAPSSVVALIDPELNTPARTHDDFVQSIAISRDGRQIATGGYRTVKLWRRSLDVKPIRNDIGPLVGSFAWSPDGSRLALRKGNGLVIASSDGSDLQSLADIHPQPVAAIVWLGEHVVSTDDTGSVRLTTPSTRQTVPVGIEGLTATKNWQRLDNNHIAALTADRKLQLLTLASTEAGWQMTAAPIQTPAPVVSLKAGNDSAQPQLAAALENGTVLLWRGDIAQPPATISVGGPVEQLVVSPNGDRLLTHFAGQQGKLWSTSDAKLVAEFKQDINQTMAKHFAGLAVKRQQGLLDRLNARLPGLKEAAEKEKTARDKVVEEQKKAADELAAAAKTVEEKTAAVTEDQAAVDKAKSEGEAGKPALDAASKTLEAKQKELTDAEAKKQSAEAAVAKRNQALATANDSTDRATAAVPALEKQIEATTNQLNAFVTAEAESASAALPANEVRFAFASDATTVLLVSNDGQVRTFDSASGQPIATEPGPGSLVALTSTPSGYTGITSTGQWLQWTSKPTWTLQKRIGSVTDSPFPDRVTALDFSPDGTQLVVGGGEPSRSGSLWLVDAASGSVSNTWEDVHSDSVLDARFSPSGRLIASAASDKLCKIINAADGSLIRNLEGHSHHVLAVSWRSDELLIATASADSTARIWNAETGQSTRTIGGYPKEVSDITFIGSSTDAVTSCVDGTVRIFNADNGSDVRRMNGPGGTLFTVSAAELSGVVFAGCQNGTTFVWKIADGSKIGELSTAPTTD